MYIDKYSGYHFLGIQFTKSAFFWYDVSPVKVPVKINLFKYR